MPTLYDEMFNRSTYSQHNPEAQDAMLSSRSTVEQEGVRQAEGATAICGLATTSGDVFLE